MNGMDKICFGSKFDPEILGIYSYAIALATSSNLVVEAVKKVIVPQMYKDYSRFNELSSNTQKLRNKLMTTIFVIQTIAPFVLFYLLRYMDLIKIEYYQYDNFILVLFLNSISFAFFSFYHFLNPLYISLKKSNWMTLSMAIAILVYLSLFILLNTNDILNLSIYRFIMFLIPPLTLIILKSKLKTGN
ncbi:hypothetical protein FNJ87_18350 [Nonlabens mediterrranea]|uniref:Polysaccharide biosynthesis protein n=1 Tax=Nonlabens mediterrranea TaxID=1419947 RepID=A0ABS0A9W2_9FLAO|nr:hypothetical protein [Nonlabens mediterrranea]